MSLAAKIICACGLALCLAWGAALAPALAADAGEERDPQAIEKKLRELQVFYTNDHPTVIRLREHLRKARALEAEKKAEKRAKDPEALPEINRDFKASESFQ